jgi:biopolymer transport protein ExbD
MKIQLSTAIKKKGMTAPSMAPLIDVVFQLLIFFMLTSAIAIQDRLEVKLPEAESGKDQAAQAITVLVGSDGELAVNNVITAPEGLAESLREAKAAVGGNTIMIKADAVTRTAEVVHVLRMAREAGMENVKIATQLASTP